MNRLGELLRELRQQRGLSQERLAAQTQVTARALRYWEANQQQPRAVELESVLRALAATPQERAQVYALLTAPRGERLARSEEAAHNIPTSRLGALPGVGDLVRTMRLRRGWTQKHLAQEMRVSRSTVLRWEATQTFPSEEDMERLCAALRAIPEEKAALRARRLLPSSWQAQLSLDECLQYYQSLTQIRKEHLALWPLVDLYALALKRQVRFLLGQSSEAVRLLAKVEMQHSWWLFMRGQTAEARVGEWRALNLVRGAFAPEEFWQSALSVLSYLAAHGPRGGAAGIEVLRPWLRLVPVPLQTWLWCDMALYAGWAQQQEQAGFYLKQARKAYHQGLGKNAEEEWYYQVAQARVLMSGGQAQEALEWLPTPAHQGEERIFEEMLWAEAWLTAGEKDRAARALSDIQTRLGETPLQERRNKLERLARQL